MSSPLSSPPPLSPPQLDSQPLTLENDNTEGISQAVHPAPRPSTSETPSRLLASKTPYYAIEYPGYVQSCDSSLSHAINKLGGQKSLNHTFSEGGRILELRLQPDNPFAHPVTGDVVGTNKLLVKVVTRRKKRSVGDRDSEAQPNEDTTQSTGTYSAEIVGVIPKTVRFRSMADFQYQPDEDDYLVQMRHAMDRLDVDAIQSFDFKPLTEGYGGTRAPKPSNAVDSDQMDVDVEPDAVDQLVDSTTNTGPKSQLHLIPPPLFSRQGISQHYNLKQNPMSVIHTTVNEETGEETRRYIHKHRIKGSLAPATVSWENDTVPTEPPKHVLDAQPQAKPHLLTRLRDLFAQRPVWSRIALINQLPALEGREVQNTKVYVGLVAYTFSDGAWRDTLLRLGYDPRKDPQARFYQRVYFRNTANEDSRRKSIVGRRAGEDNVSKVVECVISSVNDPNSHIFDGETLHSGAASFQLCDITDSLLVSMIHDEEAIRQEPDVSDGWYTAKEFGFIKAVVRRKHFNLLQGKVISDKDCADLFVLSSSNKTARNESTGTGKKFLRKSRSKRRPIAPEKLMVSKQHAWSSVKGGLRSFLGGRIGDCLDKGAREHNCTGGFKGVGE
ncbi:hypothetical protein BDV93DRAFT_439107 [Ceratobasidium sp. AG-I]|nr:hypothetical protein BDV93DRAFT_439107 [Ceratobasidium sp. AG-I]